jgi:hypothetical protein
MLEPERPLLLLQALVATERDALAFLTVHLSLTSSTFFSHPIVRLISSLAPHNVHFYIRANSEEEITFSSNCLSGHYSHVWHVDDKIVAETSDYFAKLSAGEPRIRATIAI